MFDKKKSKHTLPSTTHLLVVLRCLPQCHHDLLWKISRFGSTPADTLAFGVVHIPEVIQSSCLTHLTQIQGKHVTAEGWCVLQSASLVCLNISPAHLVADVSRYVQVPLTANHGLVEPPQHLQGISQVSAGFCFSKQVTNCPTQPSLC